MLENRRLFQFYVIIDFFFCQDYLFMNGLFLSYLQFMKSGGLFLELKQFIDLEFKSIGDSMSDIKSMNENKIDDEKMSFFQMLVKNDVYIVNREREVFWYNLGEGVMKLSYVEEIVFVVMVLIVQLFLVSRMDGLFLKLDEDEGLFGN